MGLDCSSARPGMLLFYPTKTKVAVAAAVIFLLGSGAGALSYRTQQAHLTRDILHDASLAAVGFSPTEIARLTGTRGDTTAPAYLAAKAQLAKLKAANPQIRYAYVFRVSPSPRHVFFLADSSTVGAKDEATPGEPYPESSQSTNLRRTIETGQPEADGPLHDGTNDWVTSYARIGGSATTAPGMDLLGIDTLVDSWGRELWGAAVRTAASVWVLLGLPVFALVIARRQGEQRDAIRNLSEAVEQSHSAIMILDLEQRIEYVNRGVCQQIGYSRRELIGRHWRDWLVTYTANTIVTDLVATIQSGQSWEGEWINQRKDGTTYPARGMVTPVKHRDGAMACFVAIFDDATDTKRKEAELREARDLAQAGDRAKGQFLATMSHEVRTPLNGIVGFTSLLLDTPLSTEQREFVQTIRASGEALIELTGDILDFARIESGKLKLDPIACDPRECIEEALDLHAARAAEKGIELLHRATEEVPAAVVVDGGRLRQVLVNLVGNAVKFTERGEVEVTVAIADNTQPMDDAAPLASPTGSTSPVGTPPARNVTLQFTIRDTGIGISPDQHGRLFKPFSQIDESSTRRYGGAGLGLAICKNLVQLMGGTISVESKAGQGTTFRFTVIVPVAAPRPPQRDLEGLRIGLAARPNALRRELVTLLDSWGAKVVEAGASRELIGAAWDLAMIEVDEATARTLAGQPEPTPELPPQKAIALVSISLPSELRAALRVHFRLLVNRPIHHGPLFAMLSGSRPSTGDSPIGAATQFGFRVLVVEDNHVNQRLMERVLTALGCTYRVVANGLEAINELSQHAADFDLVLLDLHMPELDGLSALERIRRGEAGPRAQTMWVAALTADVRPEQRTRGFALGLNDYLTKPLRVPELEAAFRRYRTERLARKS
jgi:PAS domain S-box-containing protein